MEQNSKVAEEPVCCNGSAKKEFKVKIVWRNVFLFGSMHVAMLYGFYLMFAAANWKTSLFAIVLEQLAFLGVTAGSHRLWSHRSYKARWPLRVLLCILNCISFQNDIFEWARDHRVHHKFTETDADPHNIRRGFFFAHIGWLLCKKHPDVFEKGKTVSLDDVWADPIVRFQRRYFYPLILFFCFYLPTMTPVWWWNETLWNSFFVQMARYGASLNCMWLVNSAAHKYGSRPFDKNIDAAENPLVALLATGEGWHNYHHVFPWDYTSSELGGTFNLAKVFIDFMAAIGLAYDLKNASEKSIHDRKLRSGDGTRVSLKDKQARTRDSKYEE